MVYQGQVIGVGLDERKLQVLRAVVESYVQSAEPVSSRMIARRSGLGVSSATIRNEMSDLEELGFLEQPHTSAGRVPSDKGYRFYVDRLMRAGEVSDEDVRPLKQAWRRAEQLESLMHVTAHALAQVTSYLSIVFGPSMRASTFHSIHMHLISEERAVMLILNNFGLAQNAVVEVPSGSREEDLRAISLMLTTELAGLPMERAVIAIRELDSQFRNYRIVLEQIYEVLSRYAREDKDRDVYLDGALNMMQQPEFQDVEKLRLVLSCLEDEGRLATIFGSPSSGTVSVTIGSENRVQDIKDCSVVWATFLLGGQEAGVVGVLGPRRMNYGRVVSLVDLAKSQLPGLFAKNVG